MRVRTPNKSSSTQETINFNINLSGDTLNVPLFINNTPTDPLELVNKQYVDSKLNNLNGDNFTSGTISEARLPAFTGDVTNIAGSSNFVLNNTGVVPGTYTKVTVNIKGLVTAGGSLIDADIPNLDWSKITTGKPTTLDGYGITDAANKNGDTLTGALILHADPTDNAHLVTKQYADSAIASISSLPEILSPGDVIYSVSPNTPSGFLKCNGARVSKTTYSNLYGVIGDNIGSGYGKPWERQYDFNTRQFEEILNWSSGTFLLPALKIYGRPLIVTKDRVYLIGSSTGNDDAGTYTAPLDLDGTIGVWSPSPSQALPPNINYPEAVVANNTVYIMGGYNENGPLNTVYFAPIDANGILGSWTQGPSLPTPIVGAQAVVIKDKIYLMGGCNTKERFSVISPTAYYKTIYVATINSNGTLSSWSLANTSLPLDLAHFHAIVIKNRLYIIGGLIKNQTTKRVFSARIKPDGTLGPWVITGPHLPESRSGSQVVVTKGRVYLLGGLDKYDDPVTTIYYADINLDGTLSQWVESDESLPAAIGSGRVIVTNSKVYIFGGDRNFIVSQEYADDKFYFAPISGGLNDYSLYYRDPSTAVDPDNFILPDYYHLEYSLGIYTYIKY